MSGFGDKERGARHLNSATVYLETPEENNTIKVLIIPEIISTPLKSHHKHAGHVTYLKGHIQSQEMKNLRLRFFLVLIITGT
jgi:hypothetical protein